MNTPDSRRRAFHVWFSTKGRKPALVDEIGEFVRQSFTLIATRSDVQILAMEAIEDHVHLLLALRSWQSLPVVMHDLKGTCARDVFRHYPELRLDMESNSFWQKSYGYRYVPTEQIETVKHYIETQSDRPLRHE